MLVCFVGRSFLFLLHSQFCWCRDCIQMVRGQWWAFVSSLGRFGAPKCHQSEHESYCAVDGKKEIRLTHQLKLVLYFHYLQGFYTSHMLVWNVCTITLPYIPTCHTGIFHFEYFKIPSPPSKKVEEACFEGAWHTTIRLYIPGGCLGFLNHQQYVLRLCFTGDVWDARNSRRRWCRARRGGPTKNQCYPGTPNNRFFSGWKWWNTNFSCKDLESNHPIEATVSLGFQDDMKCADSDTPNTSAWTAYPKYLPT